MTQTTKTRRAGRRRWSELVKFLTTTMKESGSERVRMAAALRLADILSLREQREILELKAQARVSGTPVSRPEDDSTDEGQSPAEPETDEHEQHASRVFGSIMKGSHNELPESK